MPTGNKAHIEGVELSTAPWGTPEPEEGCTVLGVRGLVARALFIRPHDRSRLSSRAGFTLLELLVVISIILLLIGMAVGRYDRSVQRSREATLRQDLSVMRSAIQQFTLDKQAAPQSLDELVSAGYLRDIPVDPVTQKKDWQTVSDDLLLSPDQTSTGITDVHSASNAVSPFENTPYSSW